MKYQIKNNNDKLEEDRIKKLKIDLQLDTYKGILPILDLLSNNINKQFSIISAINVVLNYFVFNKEYFEKQNNECKKEVNKFTEIICEFNFFVRNRQSIIRCFQYERP